MDEFCNTSLNKALQRAAIDIVTEVEALQSLGIEVSEPMLRAYMCAISERAPEDGNVTVPA